MRKILWISIISALTAAVIFYLANQAEQDPRISTYVYEAAEKGEQRIDLMEAAQFEWDDANVFGPYTTDEMIEDTMGIRFSGDNGGIDTLDDRFLLVFASKGKAVKTAVLSRTYGNYEVEDGRFLIIMPQN